MTASCRLFHEVVCCCCNSRRRRRPSCRRRSSICRTWREHKGHLIASQAGGIIYTRVCTSHSGWRERGLMSSLSLSLSLSLKPGPMAISGKANSHALVFIMTRTCNRVVVCIHTRVVQCTHTHTQKHRKAVTESSHALSQE